MLRVINLFVFFLLSAFGLIACASSDWRTADRSSVGIAPLAQNEPEALVHVYVARTFNWHKYLAVHSWVAIKEKNASKYHIYHVMGWRARRGGDAVQIEKDLPDRRWFGSDPHLISELKGPLAERAIPKIKAAVESYPYPKFYRMYPGPNSNTFVAHIIRNVSELQVELPANAVGKDWIGEGDFFSRSESGTGFQVSLFGLLGFTLGLGEGVEVNLLGLSFGLDVLRPALKLPGFGRIGVKDAPVFKN